MTGFVYKWTNTINGKWYIGSRKGIPADGYRHSSKIMKLAEKKYGIENFIREILFEGDYELDRIREIEGTLLWFYNAANDPASYNLTNIVGPECLNEKVRLSMSKKAIGNKNGKGNRGKTPWNKDKKTGPWRAEDNQRRSDTQKKNLRHLSDAEMKSRMISSCCSPDSYTTERIDKIRKSNTGKTRSEKARQNLQRAAIRRDHSHLLVQAKLKKGSIWCNNGQIENMCHEIPASWQRGRLKRKIK